MSDSSIRKALSLLILVLAASSSYAQTAENTPASKTKISRRPNIPGNFLVEFGFNGTQGAPDLWQQSLLGSRTANIYYQYPLRFGRSRFSFNPGIGISFERFKFKNNVFLNDPIETPTATAVQVEKYEFALGSSRFGDGRKKVMLVNNYLEIPLEFRFDSKPEDLSRSFNIAIGARGGWMYDSFMKVKYRQAGQTKKMKDKQDYGLTQLRYGVYTRVGIGPFSVFAYYNLTPLFQKDMGPYNKAAYNETTKTIVGNNTSGTAMTTFTVGISLNGF